MVLGNNSSQICFAQDPQNHKTPVKIVAHIPLTAKLSVIVANTLNNFRGNML